ncbi:MAG: YafY family protein [Actinomycetota bacterium]
MRADRLMGILLLLQRGKRMTARDLAARLEVSERTIYRDIEALGAAGVPVYAEPGRNGGVRLLDGYRTNLTGLSLSEAELLPLMGLSGVLAAIGVSPDIERTESKVMMALSEDQRSRAEHSRRRIHVDLSRWWEHAEDLPHLATVADATLSSRKLRIHYKRGEDSSEVKRTLAPYGLVVQGGTWYIVASARAGTEPRIYRVSRLLAAERLDEPIEIPDDFDLATWWAGRKEEFHMTRQGYRVRVRARPRALRNLHEGWLTEPPPDNVEWTETDVSFGTRGMAFSRLLGLGTDVEVLEPMDLRDAITGVVEQLVTLYRRSSDPRSTSRTR